MVRDFSRHALRAARHVRAFLALPWRSRAWLLHAVIYVAGIRAALILVPLHRTRRGLRRWGSLLRLPRHVGTIHRATWALDVASGVIPGGANCFVRALALQTLLAHRDLVTEIYIGFRSTPDGETEGHAWLEHCGAVLTGDVDDLEDFRAYGTRY